MLRERDQRIALARDEGVTVTELAQRFEISHQRVSAVMKSVTRLVDRMDLDLMVAAKTGEMCIFVIPYSEDYTTAVAFSDYLVRRLRDRGMQLQVKAHRASNGLGLELTEIPRKAK